MKQRKKLIEVALPLDAINTASAREKSIRHGHPSTLHLWWARRPLAAARAVIFAQMVDDPSSYVDELRDDREKRAKAEKELRKRQAEYKAKQRLSKKEQTSEPEPTLDGVLAELERTRLFEIIEELVVWENTTNETVLNKARTEIWLSWKRACKDNADHPQAAELFNPEKLPAFHDPFAGGGALPLEAQRLGLEAYASDLNPVAVLINKAMIEIPPKFAGMPPVNPDWQSKSDEEKASMIWTGAQGLAEDIRYYGQWMRDEAEKRIGHLYPQVEITEELVRQRPDLKPYLGKKLTVIAWLWARTVRSPNPSFADVEVPLASTFMLSTKKGKEAYVEPTLGARASCPQDKDASETLAFPAYRFTVKMGKPANPAATKRGTKLARANFACLISGALISGDYIKAEGKAGRMGARLMAVVAEGDRGRVYLPPTAEMELAAQEAKPTWKPEGDIATRMTGGNCTPYGLTSWGDLFTPRQLVALTTFSDLVQEARERIKNDAVAAGLPDDDVPLRDGGTGAVAYAEAVAVYLSMALDRMTNTLCTIARWTPDREQTVTAFARQAIPMTWDFPDVNPFAGAAGDYGVSAEGVIKGMPNTTEPAGFAVQQDAACQTLTAGNLVSTDPPYYDNIGYADLSDFFYVWLRRSLRRVFPQLFSTLAVPKGEELVATPYRHGSKEKAEEFFLKGMTQAMQRLVEQAHPAFPVSIYYAFKQSEKKGDTGLSSTGWETFLEAVMQSGFTVTGTWPMRTELGNRMISSGTNALASSIVLVCRRRGENASLASRGQFLTALKRELPEALRLLQSGNVAPVDLAQAAIGPGMAVFSRHSKVIEPDGAPMRVRTALALINEVLDEFLAEQEGEFDADTRWALTWFQQHGMEEGPYGDAETLSTAKDTSVEGMAEAGFLHAKAGNVRLLRRDELNPHWDPATDTRLAVWEITQQLIHALETQGEAAAAGLVRKVGHFAEIARDLAYRLYTVCERKGWAQEAIAYNGLVIAWPEITKLAAVTVAPGQQEFDGMG